MGSMSAKTLKMYGQSDRLNGWRKAEHLDEPLLKTVDGPATNCTFAKGYIPLQGGTYFSYAYTLMGYNDANSN